MFSFTEEELERAEAAHARERAAKPRPDMIPLLCAEIARLCDILRGERAYLALCTVFPSSDSTAPSRVREGQLREQNALFLLREKRAELVHELNSLTA